MDSLRENTITPNQEIEHKPIFDGGTFTIEYLPDSPVGLGVTTLESLLRHEPNTPMPEASRIRTQRDNEPKKFRVGPGFAPKVGIRNIQRNGDNLTLDIKPVTFPTYKDIFSISESKESLEVSNPAATAGILLTTESDGSHKLIVQHRSKNNYPFGDIPGASVAGYLDGQLDPNNRGRLIPIDTKKVKGNLEKELDEELGIHVDDVDHIRITAIAKDKTRVHDEFLLFGISNLTTEQITQKVIARKKEKRPNDEFDFEGNYFVIGGTPEAIFKLLTEVKCPLPPTHTAAFVAAGYSLMIDRDGLDSAKKWLSEIESGVKQNYEEIDAIVRKFWMANTDKAVIKPDEKPERDLNGYDPSYIPSEQGLPDITSELVRTGLIEIPTNKEGEIRPENAWLFDIDGVITNPTEKMITEPEIIDELIIRLKRGEPVALVSGRAMSWIKRTVVDQIKAQIDDVSLLDNLFVSAEFGGINSCFLNGEDLMTVDHEEEIPPDIIDKATRLIKEKYEDVAFIDEEKQIQFTVEMLKGITIEQFRLRQKEFSEALRGIVEESDESSMLEVHVDRIATNIKNRNLNKHFAARGILSWLKARNVSPETFRVFGDSITDLEMGRELTNSGKNVKFIFVGDDEIEDEEFTIINQGNVDKGTLEYLKSN